MNPASEMPIRMTEETKFDVYTDAGVVSISSMLHDYETAALYALVRHHWTGEGAILDLGPFNGISTFALAAGAKAGGHEANARIYSYDLWVRSADYVPYAQTPTAALTGSVFSDWCALNREHANIVHACPGDLLSLDWADGNPIGLMFVDLAKSWALNNWVAQKCYPNLLPGGFIVHQDWIHYHQFWLHLTMAHLRRHFSVVDVAYGSTMIFQSIEPVPRIEDLSQLSLASKLRLHDIAMDMSPPAVREVMKSARAYMRFVEGDRRGAETELAAVSTEPDADPSMRCFAVLAVGNRADVESVMRWSNPESPSGDFMRDCRAF
jgi:hypothetical protein